MVIDTFSADWFAPDMYLSTAKQKWAKGQRKMLPLWGCDNHRIDERQHPGSRACPIAGGCPDALARQGQSVLIGV